MDSVNAAKLYDGDGGNAQTEFILDSEVGWAQVVNNPNLHVTEGVSEYEYLKTLLPKLTGQAKKLLTLYLKEWDWRIATNPNLHAARLHELDRMVWRAFYKQRAVHCCPGGLPLGQITHRGTLVHLNRLNAHCLDPLQKCS